MRTVLRSTISGSLVLLAACNGSTLDPGAGNPAPVDAARSDKDSTADSAAVSEVGPATEAAAPDHDEETLATDSGVEAEAGNDGAVSCPLRTDACQSCLTTFCPARSSSCADTVCSNVLDKYLDCTCRAQHDEDQTALTACRNAVSNANGQANTIVTCIGLGCANDCGLPL
jgi:hypothetical protein